jgi:histone deacetylase 1/2
MGQMDYFLGIEVHHLSSGALLLNQAKYIRDLLSKTKMYNSKSIGSPMMSSCRLSKVGSDVMTDPTLYRSTVGALQYATITRPDIAFSVNKVCQFMANPLDSHWKAVKRILRYLKGTMHHGLLISPSNTGPPFSLSAPTVMLTGLPIMMIDGPRLAHASILVLISFPGALRSSS